MDPFLYLVRTENQQLSNYELLKDILSKRPELCQKENKYLQLCLKINNDDVRDCR
jgi:hypothetical protein